MKIAIAQINSNVGALQENLAHMLDTDAKLASLPEDQRPDLVVYPAAALTGGPLDGLLTSTSFYEAVCRTLDEFVARVQLPSLLRSYVLLDAVDEDAPIETQLDLDYEDYLIAPEVFCCERGQVQALGFSESALMEAIGIPFGEKQLIIRLSDPHQIDDLLYDNDILITIPDRPLNLADEDVVDKSFIRKLEVLARDTGTWVIEANRVGAQDRMVYPGGSYIISDKGRFQEGGVFFEETVLMVDTNEPAVEKAELDFPDIEKVRWLALCAATKDYVRKNGFTDVVLGLSGGIDSALIATIAADALGPGHVHAVLMPSEHSSDGSVVDAEALAANIGVKTIHLPIDEPFAATREAVAAATGEEVVGLARENMQARLRTVYLMTLSNQYGWMLLNTGNKSEAAMGFSTLYGDTAGAFAPLGNLYKTELYELSRWRNTFGAVIPEAIIEKEPSAELYDGARDADRLPPYEILDSILGLYLEDGLSADEIVFEGYDPEVVQRVLATVAANEYKRRCEPMAPLFENIALTEERAWPVTNCYRD
jgi:NAD+ synthase (glutamine-hydrolysing)